MATVNTMHMMKIKRLQTVWHVLLTVLAALLVATGMHVFVYPGGFAPSGVDGIATVLQSVTGLNAGLFVLAINLPLLLAAWFVLNRRYVLYTVLYTVLLSFFLWLLASVQFYQYTAEGERLLAAVFGGVAQGLTGIMLRIGSSSGGVDILGSMVQKRLSHRNVESIISLFSIAIVGLSLLVYRNLHSALLSVIEIAVCERVAAGILKNTRNAVKFEVVTAHPERIRREILFELGHGATVIEGRGLYSEQGKSVIFCVVTHRQIPHFLRFASACPDTFVYYAELMGVRGNFDRSRPLTSHQTVDRVEKVEYNKTVRKDQDQQK